MGRRFPLHPSHSPAPEWLHTVADDLTRLGYGRLADSMGLEPTVERQVRR